MSNIKGDVRGWASVVSYVRMTIDADHVADPRRMTGRSMCHRQVASDERRGDSKRGGGEIIETMSGYHLVMSETM
jgi:hypothetical protein